MKYTETICSIRIQVAFLILLGVSIISSFQTIAAQEPPPKPIVVTVTAQTLSFGAFTYATTTGTVTINPDGSRSSSGTVIPLNLAGYPYTAALFQLVGTPGTVITLLQCPDVNLTRGGGGSMTLQIGASNPATPFVITTTPPSSTPLYLGGTLLVGTQAVNPPGSYSGTYLITFVQE
jgi:hypothetical protein